METKRASWASNLGFLMAAIGSAVGLGNIWGFPYKMGKSGGFAYLAVYALLAIFVGFIVMASELAMGRKTGQGAMGTYHALTKKFRWIGWLALFSPFAVMGFYAVLGGYCIEYMALNLSNSAFGQRIAGHRRGAVYRYAVQSCRSGAVCRPVSGSVLSYQRAAFPAALRSSITWVCPRCLLCWWSSSSVP